MFNSPEGLSKLGGEKPEILEEELIYQIEMKIKEIAKSINERFGKIFVKWKYSQTTLEFSDSVSVDDLKEKQPNLAELLITNLGEDFVDLYRLIWVGYWRNPLEDYSAVRIHLQDCFDESKRLVEFVFEKDMVIQKGCVTGKNIYEKTPLESVDELQNQRIVLNELKALIYAKTGRGDFRKVGANEIML